jgi:hypothetical protein
VPVDVATHANYGAAAAKYQADKAAATTAGDDTALARADADWATARMGMERDLFERQDQERGRASELARIKAENPDAPPELFEGTDLAQMERAAKAVQALAASRSQGQDQSWSPPPGGAGGQSGGGQPDDSADITVEELVARGEQRNPDTGHFPTVERMMDKLAPEVLAKGAGARKENAELQAMSLEPVISKFRAGKNR